MTQIPTWSGQSTPAAPGASGVWARSPAAMPGASNGPTASSGGSTAAAAPVGRTAPGVTIGRRYALRAAVGHGGMGTVWRAADTLLHRDVAVKEVVLPAGLAPSDRDAMYERTLREARAAAALSHPAVVQVYDVVTENGRPWIVMELLDARSLADMVIEDGPLAPRAVAKIGIALLGALEVAHAAGVLHRDVKPANVLIAADGRCVLTDFGVARMPTDVQLTTPGMVLGSPHFISPERAMGGPFGPPSDLFSLGVTLYTAVEGRPPFDRGDPIETMHAVVEDPPAPPVRAGALGHVLYGLLEKDPRRRFDVATARNLLRELLAGPLASQAPPHLMTDPYAVVPAQRAAQASPPPPRPTGQIGGRAMLAPGEDLTARLTRPATDRAAPLDQTNPNLTPVEWDRPSGTGGTGRHGRRGGGGAGTALAAVRSGGARVVTTVRDWSRTVQIGAAAGVVALLLVGMALLTRGGDDSGQTTPPISEGAQTQRPAFPVQRFSDRGVTVNVPKGWKRANGGVYVDFVDPDDKGRKVRILTERASAEPARFMRIAEGGLKKSPTCAKPYARLDLREARLADLPAAELEYTCGEGATMRHGIWRAVISEGRAYSFYLTAREGRFEESRMYFDEMVRSFELTAAG